MRCLSILRHSFPMSLQFVRNDAKPGHIHTQTHMSICLTENKGERESGRMDLTALVKLHCEFVSYSAIQQKKHLLLERFSFEEQDIAICLLCFLQMDGGIAMLTSKAFDVLLLSVLSVFPFLSRSSVGCNEDDKSPT